MLCLTRRPDALYLRCDEDPARISRIVAAREAGAIHIEGVAPGDYSLLVIHDENRNGRLDKMLGMPREGLASRAIPRSASARRAMATFASPSRRSQPAGDQAALSALVGPFSIQAARCGR